MTYKTLHDKLQRFWKETEGLEKYDKIHFQSDLKNSGNVVYETKVVYKTKKEIVEKIVEKPVYTNIDMNEVCNLVYEIQQLKATNKRLQDQLTLLTND